MKMKMRMLLTTLLLATCTLQADAQDELLRQVNTIKIDQRYVWGEAMDENEDVAFSAALQVMKGKLEKRLNASVDNQEILSKAKRIVRPMENMKRVTAYMEVEEAKSSKPKPVKEETPYTPRVIVNLPSGSETTVPETKVESRRTSETPASPSTPPSAPSSTPGLDVTLSSIVTSLMATEHLQGAITVLDRSKKAGTIQQYAPYSKAANPESMYILIFDAEYNIPLAVLSPEKSNGKRDNLVSDKEETVADYKDKLAVCFSLAP